MVPTVNATPVSKPIEQLDAVVIRFCGDSGDGMQLAGTQFSNVSAIFGNDISTLPDFPAEIRAPTGTLFGVSGFQVCFSSHDIHTPGDQVDTLVAMNPAALKTNLDDLDRGGLLIVDEDAFESSDWARAGYAANPLRDGSLAGYRVVEVPMTTLTRRALEGMGFGLKEMDRCRNVFALGLVCWLYDRPLESALQMIQEKFDKKPQVAEANARVFKAGCFYGETTEALAMHYRVPKAPIRPGRYRKITGNEATAYGLITAAKLAGKSLFYASYPITPASDILHELSRHKRFGVYTCQMEDEIASIGAAIGAAFGGAFAVTGTSGPGLALKAEAIGLAVMMELPVVVIDVQRGGPSTGLPTKPEQTDLLQAMFGRNGECPVAVIAPATPADCFPMIQEAFRLAVQYMTPVLFLSDAFLATSAEPWLIPDAQTLSPIKVHHPSASNAAGNGNGDGKGFLPYLRDHRLAHPWAVPGTVGLEHRIGGLEKEDITGNISYDPENHQHMVDLRAAKIAGIANGIPEQTIHGADSGELLVVGWGGTYGAITTAVQRARQQGQSVSSIHLRYLNPLPRNLGEILSRFKKILVPELNLGQLRLLLRGQFPVQPIGLNKVQGRPFRVAEICAKIDEVLKA